MDASVVRICLSGMSQRFCLPVLWLNWDSMFGSGDSHFAVVLVTSRISDVFGLPGSVFYELAISLSCWLVDYCLENILRILKEWMPSFVYYRIIPYLSLLVCGYDFYFA